MTSIGLAKAACPARSPLVGLLLEAWRVPPWMVVMLCADAGAAIGA